MTKFKIEVLETSARMVEIEANTEDEAVNIASRMYDNEDIVLNEDDFQDVTISSV